MPEDDANILEKAAPGSPVMNLLAKGCQELRGRRVFKTASGRIGLAHEPIQNGDILCVIDSAPSPHVLRRSLATQEERYLLVSEAFMTA